MFRKSLCSEWSTFTDPSYGLECPCLPESCLPEFWLSITKGSRARLSPRNHIPLCFGEVPDFQWWKDRNESLNQGNQSLLPVEPPRLSKIRKIELKTEAIVWVKDVKKPFVFHISSKLPKSKQGSKKFETRPFFFSLVPNQFWSRHKWSLELPYRSGFF